MTRSIWRLSHLSLALVASLFLILASISGLFLVFEPVQNRMDSTFEQDWNSLPLSTAIDSLKAHNFEVTCIERDQFGYYVASVFTEEGEQLFYRFNPENGQKTGEVVQQSKFFQWVTTFHRSLFLDQVGRFFVGATSLILVFIAISGIILVIQRSRSLKSLVDKVEKTLNVQFYHIVFGRLAFIPIIIISLTGTYLFLQRFDVIKKVETPQVEVDFTQLGDHTSTFDFSQVTMDEIVKVDFPLFPDEEEFYVVQLKDRVLAVNQFDYSILNEVEIPSTTVWSNLSLNLHTGRTSVLWALILGLASISILYFIYSGFKMTLLKQKGKTKNKYKLSESEVLILVGSESGNTQNYAKLVFNALLESGVKAYISELNAYKPASSIQSVLIFTATYGNGEAPANASKFLKKWKNEGLKHDFTYSIVGFGSLAYPDFCQFAIEIEREFKKQGNAKEIVPLTKIHNQSYHSLKTWAADWKNATSIQMDLPASLDRKKLPLSTFQVVEKNCVNVDGRNTFTLKLKTIGNSKFQSGDLLAFYPPEDGMVRYYSIGKIAKDELIISVKKHEFGICSSFLMNLNPGDKVDAGIKQNPSFHYRSKQAGIFIGNGTGIGPFLGMSTENTYSNELSVYWGSKNRISYTLYEDHLAPLKEKGQINSINLAFSREGIEKVYVGDLILRDGEQIVAQIKSGGIIYICGSLAMQQDVLAILTKLCQQYSTKPLSHYQNRNQILMDCY